jgi:hypothetical protein
MLFIKFLSDPSNAELWDQVEILLKKHLSQLRKVKNSSLDDQQVEDESVFE